MAALLHLLQQHPHPLLHPRHHRRRLQQRAAAQRAARDRAVLLRRPGPRPPGTPRLRARSRQPLMPGPLARRRQRARCRQRGRYRAPSAASTRAPHAAWTRASPGRDQTHALHAASTEPKKGLSLSPSVPPSLRPSSFPPPQLPFLSCSHSRSLCASARAYVRVAGLFLVRHASLWTDLDSRPISPRSAGTRTTCSLSATPRCGQV